MHFVSKMLTARRELQVQRVSELELLASQVWMEQLCWRRRLGPWATVAVSNLVLGHRLWRANLGDHAHNETLLLDAVRFNGVRILENLAYSRSQRL